MPKSNSILVSRDRAKVALVPILAIALAAILWWPWRNDVSVPELSSVTKASVRPRSHRHLPAPRPVGQRVDIETLTSFNPFDPHAPTPQNAEAQNTALDQNKASPMAPVIVQAVYQDAKGTVAIVDSRIVRPGDTLDGIGRIMQITSSGLTIEQP